MSAALDQIQSRLRETSVVKDAGFYKKMVPGKQKVYGVKTPILNSIVKEYRTHSFDLAEKLWAAGALEERIIAIKIIEKEGKKDPTRVLKLFGRFAKGIDNWAVCDGLGMQFLRGIVKTHSKEIFTIAHKYNRSPDAWLRRLSLVMVEWYTREKSHTTEIKKLVQHLENDDEYYVKKAVIWIKKNFQKGK